MIKLHDAEENFDIWVNENHIVTMETGTNENETDLFFKNGIGVTVTETPEEILALMGETTQPAPAKNNITKWIESVEDGELEGILRDNTCPICPANDRCCQYGLTECSQTIKRWALEVSE